MNICGIQRCKKKGTVVGEFIFRKGKKKKVIKAYACKEHRAEIEKWLGIAGTTGQASFMIETGDHR